MIIIYNTDCAYTQKRIVGLHNAHVNLRRDSLLPRTREKEKSLSTPSTRMTVSVASDFTEYL